jgi:hypothetical protein
MSGRAIWVLAVCLGASPALVMAAPPEASEARPAARAESPVKPTGPIAVEHRLGAEPAVGVPLTITISARVSGSTDGLRLETSGSRPGAVLLTEPTLVASGESGYSWTLTVVPLEADAGYLNVIVVGNIDGLPQARSVAIALRSPVAEARPEPEAAADTETLIALPVRETP